MLPATSNLSVLLKIILNRYFVSVNCINSISIDAEVEWPRPILQFDWQNSTDHLVPLMTEFGCHGFVVQTDRPMFLFDKLEDIIRFTYSTKFHERRYLFVPPLDRGEYLDDIFRSEKLEYVADMLLVRQVDGGFDMYTNRFTGVCNHTEAIFLDSWFAGNRSFLYGRDLYPNKFHNQMGRTLRISTFDYKPYINIDSEHGIELMMTKEYAKFHNLSTNIIIETEFWGVINDSTYTANGAKGTLLSDKCDISLGSWYRLPNYTKYFDLTESTVRIGVTFLVPAPKLAGGWFTPLFSFSTPLWLGFILTYLALIISFLFFDWFSLKYIRQEKFKLPHLLGKSVVINTVLLYCQQSINVVHSPSGFYLRHMLVVIILISLFFSATYSGGFAMVMTIPRYEKSIQDSMDLENSGIKWGAIHPALLDGFRDLPKYKNVVKNIVILTDGGIKKKMHKQGFAMLADRVPNGLVVADRIDYRDVRYYKIIKDDLYWDHCILLVKRSSVLIPSIRDTFLAMKEGGLVYYFELQASFEDNFKAQQALKFNTEEATVVKLSWMHVQGAFAALWIGSGIGLVCFCIEIVKFRRSKTKNNRWVH